MITCSEPTPDAEAIFSAINRHAGLFTGMLNMASIPRDFIRNNSLISFLIWI